MPAGGSSATARRASAHSASVGTYTPASTPDVDLAELHVTGDPGQRFAREATFDDGAQEDGIAGGMRDEVVRLVLRRDETGFGEPGDECATIGRERHVRHWSTWGRSPVTRLLCHPTALSPDCYVTRPRNER